MRALAALSLFVYLAPNCHAEEWTGVHAQGREAAEHRDFETAAGLFRRSLPLARTEAQNAISANDLAIALCQSGHEAEAKIWLERALAIWKKDPANLVRYAETAFALANVDRTLGNYSMAEAVLRAGLEKTDAAGGTRSYLLSALGDIMREEGNYAESRRLLKEAQDVAGVPWRQRLDVKLAIARLERESRNWDVSIDAWNQAGALARENGDTTVEAGCLRGLGQTWLDRGNLARAEPLMKAALAKFEGEPRRDDAEIATTLTIIGQLYLAQDKTALAEEVFLRSLASEERSLGATHPQTAMLLELLADVVSRRKELELARGYLDRAEKIMVAQFGELSPISATVFANRAVIEQRAGNADKAATQYRRALDALSTAGADMDEYRHQLMTQYAQLLKSLHHKQEANMVLAQAAAFRSAR
jgi:tetratricopeptide (TPR) repeat protein